LQHYRNHAVINGLCKQLAANHLNFIQNNKLVLRLNVWKSPVSANLLQNTAI